MHSDAFFFRRRRDYRHISCSFIYSGPPVRSVGRVKRRQTRVGLLRLRCVLCMDSQKKAYLVKTQISNLSKENFKFSYRSASLLLKSINLIEGKENF